MFRVNTLFNKGLEQIEPEYCGLVKYMAMNVTIEKRPNSILIVVLLIMAVGVYMALVSVHALVTGSEYVIEGILILTYLDSFSAGILSLVMALIILILGFSLWNMMKESRMIILAISGLGTVFYPLKALVLASELTQKGHVITGPETISSILTVLGIFFSLFVLLTLSRQEVILAFEANEVVRIKRRLAYLKEKMERGRKRCADGEISKAELSKLRSECLTEERDLKGRIRHFDKVRLVRERKIKDRLEKKKKAKEEKLKKKAKKEEEAEEKKAEKESKEEESEEEDEEKGEEE
jgi:hypothetical protein